MPQEYSTLASIINTLGTKYDLLDLVDYLADMLFIHDENERQSFREKCLFTQREQIL
ncbi:MAG: hypothetical protein KKD29_07390 [Candidatus Omnitrophica bacterium]|nr:hypothetical protein [Candidatus Omnitrophota bacterium]MBU4487600.1 hypothetical protein [Candidatus Omnitrophota bacterium]MCG2705084.1 hypothetical protein [Candidatus Omnitrophota bacterium]